MMPLDLSTLTVADAAAWRLWLSRESHHSKGVWLTLAKKSSTGPAAAATTSITHAQALEEALCVGWIDAQSRKRDSVSWSQIFMPRSPRSIWSQRNVGLIAQLEAQGRMTPAGLAVVEKAKADGRWDAAYARPADAKLPEEHLEMIRKVPAAWRTWEGLSGRNRWAVYFRVCSLKTQKGRERRMQRFVEELAKGETPYPQAAKGGKLEAATAAAPVGGAGKTAKAVSKRTTRVVEVATVRPIGMSRAKTAKGADRKSANSTTASTRILRPRGDGKADG